MNFRCIEVSTAGFERHAAISLRDLLNNILDKLDVSVEFTGACFMVTWYHKTREPTFPKDVCYICNKEIKDDHIHIQPTLMVRLKKCGMRNVPR